MNQKSLLCISLFVFTAPASLSTIASLKINNQQSTVDSRVESRVVEKQHLPNQKIMLNVALQSQGQRNCFCTCVEGLFRFFGMTHARNGTPYTIESIFEQIRLPYPGGTIDFHTDYTYYINREFRVNNVSQHYWQLEIPANFGASNYDMTLFHSYVISALQQGAPVIFNTRHRHTGHAIVINGIQPSGRSTSETIYYYQDPAHSNNPVQLQFTGAEIRNFFTRGNGYVMGPNFNYDFNDRHIKINLQSETFSCNLQDQKIEKNQAVDLTRQAGITNLWQLQQFKTIKINNFMIETNWFNKNYYFNDRTWNTKNFIKGALSYKKLNPFSWFTKHNNVARGQFDTYFSAATWTEDDGNFYLNLSYQFYARALLTTTLIYLNANLGNQWILSFK